MTLEEMLQFSYLTASVAGKAVCSTKKKKKEEELEFERLGRTLTHVLKTCQDQTPYNRCRSLASPCCRVRSSIHALNFHEASALESAPTL